MTEVGEVVVTAIGMLETVAGFYGPMPVGVAVSRGERVFVSLPRWGEPVDHTVVELVDGQAVPYPDQTTNRPLPGDPSRVPFGVPDVGAERGGRCLRSPLDPAHGPPCALAGSLWRAQTGRCRLDSEPGRRADSLRRSMPGPSRWASSATTRGGRLSPQRLEHGASARYRRIARIARALVWHGFGSHLVRLGLGCLVPRSSHALHRSLSLALRSVAASGLGPGGDLHQTAPSLSRGSIPHLVATADANRQFSPRLPSGCTMPQRFHPAPRAEAESHCREEQPGDLSDSTPPAH